jgi:type III pantothenate kinase
MTLVFDIGNSSIKGGIFEDVRCVYSFRWDTDEEGAREALVPELGAISRFGPIRRAGCVSVVPFWTEWLRMHLAEIPGIPLEVLTTKSAVPVNLEYDTPDTLGVDRLAAAVGAWQRFGPTAAQDTMPDNGHAAPAASALIVLDAGTAVTYEVVDADGTYRGGPIGPGPELIRRAIQHGTAQLPRVELIEPQWATGRSTDEAIRSGIMFGFQDSVRAMLARLRTEIDSESMVIATGGWADWLSERITEIDRVEANLVLEGVREMLLYRKPD